MLLSDVWLLATSGSLDSDPKQLDERVKEILLSCERERRSGRPAGSLNPDDTIDGGVTDTLWLNCAEILVVGYFGTLRGSDEGLFWPR